jgi:hypothetical protein
MKKALSLMCCILIYSWGCSSNCTICNFAGNVNVIVQYPDGSQVQRVSDPSGCVEVPPRGADCAQLIGSQV